MRKMLGAAVVGLTALGGAVIAGGAQAQPYGYYQPAPSGYYDNGYWHPAPAPGYYQAPVYSYDNPAGVAGAVIGSLLGPAYAGPAVPVDRFGPDPNGMIAPDGHRIKCKLRSGYDDRWGRYHTYRECW